MRNLPGLIDAICDAYDNPNFVPKVIDGQQVTYCNYAANSIAQAMGCLDFWDPHSQEPLNADAIFAFLKGSPEWTEADMSKCQDLANQGSLVFAAANSLMLGQAHGHICVVRPGLPKDSGKFGSCPSVLNIGGENFIGRAKKGPLTGMACGVNEAFIEKPIFFVWRQSL